MKKSELREIIQDEIQILNENFKLIKSIDDIPDKIIFKFTGTDVYIPMKDLKKNTIIYKNSLFHIDGKTGKVHVDKPNNKIEFMSKGITYEIDAKKNFRHIVSLIKKGIIEPKFKDRYNFWKSNKI